jgi:glycosyltransferase involved in cell wall biosynthesis
MKWLSIVWYKFLPPQYGGQKGIAGFNQSLGKIFPGTCLCSGDNENVPGLSYSLLPALPVGKQQFLSRSARKLIIQTAVSEKPGFIILEHPFYSKAARKACDASGAKLILHAHNIEAERFRKSGKISWRWVKAAEKKAMRYANCILFKTDEDRTWAIKNYGVDPAGTLIVPYGIERKEQVPRAGETIRSKYKLNPSTRLFLFAGTLDYSPNAKAVEKIYKKLAPFLEKKEMDARIIICGRNRNKNFKWLKRLKHPLVIQAGQVDDIDEYLSAADLFINPVETGSGIQTKNIEALSIHCDVLSFSFGATGMDATICGNKMHVVDDGDWESFGNQMLTLKPAGSTPPSFFEYFSQARIIKSVADRLNKL